MFAIKRMVSLFLIAIMAMTFMVPTLAETSAPVIAEKQELHLLYSYEPESLMVQHSGLTSSLGSAPSTTEGILSHDKFGNLTYGLADGYTVSDDGLTYVFHIREGVHWVDCHGQPLDELTAEDFLTCMLYVTDPKNASVGGMFFENVIVGATERLSGEADNLSGVEVVGKYYMKITLLNPMSYFLDFACLYVPMPTRLLNELGDRYGMSAEETAFIGTYYVNTYEPYYQTVYLKNPLYYDADEVFIEKIVMQYNAEVDSTAPMLFERGLVDSIDVNSALYDEWAANEATADILLPVLPRTINNFYYFTFNYAPTYEDNGQEDFRKAVVNENFRQSIAYAIDRLALKRLTIPYTAEYYVSNTITPADWCALEGRDYTTLEPLNEISSRENYGYDPDKAREYRDAAIDELKAQGVTFPIRLLMPYTTSDPDYLTELEYLRQSFEEVLGADYIECVIEAGPASGFTDAVLRSGHWGFYEFYSRFNISDPMEFVLPLLGNNFIDQASGGEELTEQVARYEELLNTALAVGEKNMDRYGAFAEAESLLISHAIVIPYSVGSTSDPFIATRLNPFDNLIGTGATYKGMRLFEEPLTYDQFLMLQEEYDAEKANSTSLN